MVESTINLCRLILGKICAKPKVWNRHFKFLIVRKANHIVNPFHGPHRPQKRSTRVVAVRLKGLNDGLFSDNPLAFDNFNFI